MNKRILIVLFLLAALFWGGVVYAAPLALPKIGLEVSASDQPGDIALSLQLLALLTVLSLAPAILILMTSFTRIIVVLSFLRNALATQQMPPNQVLIGLALFLTFFTMAPVWSEMNQEAIQPYLKGEMSQEEAFDRAMEPLRTFMFNQTRENDLALFVNLSKLPKPNSKEDIPTSTLIPAFAVSELKTAFQIGFIIYIPFIVIDMVVASTLMSMGMLMLPPMMISLPFKLLLFILVDGWHLVVQTLVSSFR
ncbi:MAG: flagellar type III secretion system pore protein FliP [Peptococcaceae bacterium]|nr:flagellar type III secretion system pore protein FliP [Peptococcaceae bacterium]MDH7524050.1 flagellar type III secretion system pore protein FliP [Peptococcaceae bacterium]